MNNKITKTIVTISIIAAILVGIAIISSNVTLGKTVTTPSYISYQSGFILSATNQAENTTNTATENSTTTNSATNNTNGVMLVNNVNDNLSKNETVNNTVTNTPANTTRTVTNTPVEAKALPQTGENDIYVVSAIGIVALAIGSVSFVKSRKYQA